MKVQQDNHMKSLRSLFLIKYFERLKKQEIRFSVLRGYKNMFIEKNKDIDLLMNPQNYALATSLYKDLLREFGAVFISSEVADKNLYLKSLFIGDPDDDAGIEGLYIHMSAYVTIKTSYKNRNVKYQGTKIWVDGFDLMDGEVEGVLLPVPDAKIQILFLLSKYAQKKQARYLDDMENIIDEHALQDWVAGLDNNQCLKALFEDKQKQQIPAELFGLIGDMVRSHGIRKKSGKLIEYGSLIRQNIAQMFKLKGKLIFFSGPDGSGKTTANENLTKVLTEKLKISTINSKHLYPLSNKTSVQAQKLQSKVRRIDYDNKDALERDRGQGFVWKSRRLVGLLYILVQIWPGYIYGRYKNYRGYTVIIDTSFFDAFVKGHRPAFPLLQRISVPLIPCGDHWFLVSASPQKIVARKPELTEREITAYYDKLGRIASKSTCKPEKIPSDTGVVDALKHMIMSLDNN